MVADFRHPERQLRSASEELIRDASGRTDALRAGNNRFIKFAEIATDWFWEMDAALRFTYVSKNVGELGVTEHAVIGRTLDAVRHPGHDIEDLAEELKALRERRPYRGIERRSTVRPGLWLSVSGEPQFDAAGAFVGYYGVTSDITERKIAEIELRNNESLLRSVIDNLPVSVLAKDMDGRNTLVNATFEKWYGEPTAKVLGRRRPDLDSAAAGDGPLIEQQTRYVLATGDTVARETVRTLADGAEHHLSIKKYPIRDADGAVSGVVSVSADLTDQVNARRALSESEARFREFAEIASDWLWETDANLRLTYVSERYIDIVGTDAADYLGKTRQELAADDTTGEHWQRHLRDLADRKPFRDFCYTIENSNGRVLTVSVNGNPYFDATGKFRGYRGTTTDVSKREELNRLKSEFVSTASHELRTPLTSIHGSLQLIARGAVGEISPEQMKLIEVAARNSERLISLVNDILDLQRIESGSIEYCYEILDLNELVKQAIESNRAYADKFNVKLAMNLRQPEAWVKGDRLRLDQVLANLMSNAIKFSPEGDLVTISIVPRAGWVRVEIEDRGSGVPETFREILFDKFTQANAANDRKVNGTGLGLSISKAIVDAHGGTIDFESPVGKGATFFFDLPAAPAPDRAAAKAPLAGGGSRREPALSSLR